MYLNSVVQINEKRNFEISSFHKEEKMKLDRLSLITTHSPNLIGFALSKTTCALPRS